MKSTYEKRWGHPRFRKAVAHLAAKELKRREATTRNQIYQSLTIQEKLEKLMYVPGNASNQRAKLMAKKQGGNDANT